jgi:hypothetical protein
VRVFSEQAQAAHWSRSSRVAFRFFFVYFGLYCLATQIVGGLILYPGFSFPSLGTRWPVRDVTLWLARHLFHVSPPLVYAGNSGDTVFHWIQTGWLLAIAVLVSALWSQIDRGRTDYVVVHKWFRLFLRFGLAAQMFYFGLAKVIPTQFPAPSLVTLVEPVGQLSSTDLLWTFMGSSTAYQMFTGWAEVLGGCLLVIPRTSMLGALIALVDLVHVFVLNMTYDVGLKQISFHLILIALFILAPDLPRLHRCFVLDRPPDAPPHEPVFRGSRATRYALGAQILFGVYLVGMFTRIALISWSAAGGPGSPRSPLYGIWDVNELAVDGQLRSPLLNDYDRRWRRLIFDTPDVMVFQRTDDSFAHYGASIDVNRGSITLRKGTSRSWRAAFTFRRPTGERLILDGEMDRHIIHLDLLRLEFDQFRLLNSGFRWIRPPDPYGG